MRALTSRRTFRSGVAALLFLYATPVPAGLQSGGNDPADGGEPVVQAHVILTVSEAKRLIAKGVLQLPEVRAALTGGMVIITKGTTNTYLAEELLRRPMPHGAFVFGRVLPEKDAAPWPSVEPVPEIILINGRQDTTLSLREALARLRPGDVVIKGANALHYESQTAGILVGGGSCGTIGAAWPEVIGRRAHFIIPVGLEKQISGPVLDTFRLLREPVEEVEPGPGLFFVSGQIVTELEALRLLTGVRAFQAAAGGVGGAEGASWIVMRGSREQVGAALDLVRDIQGEPPFPVQPSDEAAGQ